MMLAEMLVSEMLWLHDACVAALPSSGTDEKSMLALLVASVGLLLVL
jgi:hypothetical protein